MDLSGTLLNESFPVILQLVEDAVLSQEVHGGLVKFRRLLVLEHV
mgnify:CR=1 FL=1